MATGAALLVVAAIIAGLAMFSRNRIRVTCAGKKHRCDF
jgi:hypothetical protein